MVEVICGERASGPPGLPCTARPGAWALRLTASAVPHAAAGPGPEGAVAAVDRLRATAARTLREHVSNGGTCARCHLAWPGAPGILRPRGGIAVRGGSPGGEPFARSPVARHAAGSHGRAERLILAMPSWARAFPGTPQQVRAARRFAASLLDGSPFCDDAVLVISELFTNALLHTDSGKAGGLVIVQVSRWLLGVRVAVTDQGSGKRPVIRDAGPCRELAESGHGLYMVGHLAERLDWHDDASGRTIHAILGTRPPEHCRQQPGSQASESSRLPQPA